jgi:hypothetical protein
VTTTEPTVNGSRFGGSLDTLAQPSAHPPTSKYDEFDDVAERVAEQRRIELHGELDERENWRVAPDEGERNEDANVNRKLRKALRRRRKRHVLTQIKAEARNERRDWKIDNEDRQEKVTLRKALRKRRQLTDPNANLASAYVRYRAVSAVLALVALAGVAWTSHGVATALGGPHPALWLYILEPLASLNLLIIVFLQVVAAENGRQHKLAPIKTVVRRGKRTRRPSATGLIEVGLLVVVMVVNTTPAFTSDHFSALEFAGRFFPPLLVTISVVLQYVSSDLFGEIIRDAVIDETNTAETERKRTARAFAIARELKMLLQSGEEEIPLQDDDLPSRKWIEKRWKIAQTTAQSARDALLFDGLVTTGSSPTSNTSKGGNN